MWNNMEGGFFFFCGKAGTDQMERSVQHFPPSLVVMVHLDACSSFWLPFPSDLHSRHSRQVLWFQTKDFLHVFEHNGTKQMMWDNMGDENIISFAVDSWGQCTTEFICHSGVLWFPIVIASSHLPSNALVCESQMTESSFLWITIETDDVHVDMDH